MASFLLQECLENIFLNFIKYPSSDDRIKTFSKNLYSCTLVSRYWCRISTPFLYAYPFNHFKNRCDCNSYFKLIRTLLSCVPQSEIRRIYTTYAQALSARHIPFNKKVSYSNISPTFNYASFIRGFIFDEMILEYRIVCDHKSIWLSAHNPESISSEKAIRIMNHLIKFICLSCNLAMLEIPFSMELGNVINLSQFISSISLQNKLQHIILLEGNFGWGADLTDYSNVFNLLSMQSVNLRTLEFNDLSFGRMDENILNLLCSLKNIRELKLRYCYVDNNVNSWAKSLTKLEVLEFTHSFNFPDDFLNQLLQSSSNTLTKLVINIDNRNTSTQKFQQVPFLRSLSSLISLIHLELPKVLPSELISIFKSCIKLVYLSVMLDDEEDLKGLKGLSRFVPKTLEGIEFKLSMNKSSFKESLGCFLEEYIIVGGALKYFEFRKYGWGVSTSKWFEECFDGIQVTAYL